MNLLISNENYKITDALNVEIIKTIKGEFTPEEIQTEIINFYFNKVIIDITAIKNYYNINSVLLFLNLFTSENIILLLNESEVVNSYLNILVENGYYNFTRNAAGINYLLTNPNSYEDVKKYLKEMSKLKNGLPKAKALKDELLTTYKNRRAMKEILEPLFR